MPPRSRKPDTDDIESADAPPLDTAENSAGAKIERDDGPSDSGTEYLNITGGMLCYDRAGHTVGADEWTPAVNLDRVGKRLRTRGHLLPRSAL